MHRETPPCLTMTERYQQLEHTSGLMLAAAQRANWPEVARLEQLARGQVAQLQAPAHGLSLSERRVRHQVLLAVLRHDALVRALADPAIDRVTRGRPLLH